MSVSATARFDSRCRAYWRSVLEADGLLPFTGTTETAFGYKGFLQLDGDEAQGRQPVEVYVVGRLTEASFDVPASASEHVRWPPASLWEGDYQRNNPSRRQAPQYDVEAILEHKVTEVNTRPKGRTDRGLLLTGWPCVQTSMGRMA